MDYLSQDGGKLKTKSKQTSSKKTSSKKGGNFLGTVGELVAPSGWETFATTAGLFALDRADAGLRRGKSEKKSVKSTAKKGGESLSSKKSSSKKGGNFLGSVGELVAPSGWETFATTAGLFALDRADSAFRRGKSTKSSAKKGGMSGGNPIKSIKELNRDTFLDSRGFRKLKGSKPNTRQATLNEIAKQKLELAIEEESKFGSYPTDFPNSYSSFSNRQKTVRNPNNNSAYIQSLNKNKTIIKNTEAKGKINIQYTNENEFGKLRNLKVFKSFNPRSPEKMHKLS
jgi:hypothetical protein